MDSVFHSRTKRWIHPVVRTSEDGLPPTSETGTDEADFSSSVSFPNFSSLLGIKIEGLDGETILGLGLDRRERAHDDRIDEIDQMLRFGLEDETDNLSAVSDVSDQELDPLESEVNDNLPEPEIEETPTAVTPVAAQASPEEEIPENLSVGLQQASEAAAAVDEVEPLSESSTATGIRRVRQRKKPNKLELDDEPSKKSRRRQQTVNPESSSASDESVKDWKDLVRVDLGMTPDEYEEFVSSQGFLETSSQLKDIVDFGTQKAKGFPTSAKPIEKETEGDLVALKIYQNIFRPNVLAGTMTLNAVDLSMYSAPKARSTGTGVPVEASDWIAKVDLYFPSLSIVQFRSHVVKKLKLPGLSLSIDILLSQTVKDLFNILHCENDLVCTKEMQTLEDVKGYLEKFATNFTKSGFFTESSQNASIFIGNHLYVLNKSTETNPNYGDVLKAWKGQQDLNNPGPIGVRLMSEHQLKDIDFRPGFPYLYRHDDCEHILVFTNVRRLHATDPKDQSSYPKLTHLHRKRPIKCGPDPNHVARVVVKNDHRLPEVSTPMCIQCCERFCFRKYGRRIIKATDFQLYPLLQMDNLPISILSL